MSRTRKNPKHIQPTILEVIKRNDGTFDILLNHRLDRKRIPERWLADEICVRFGFCGEEYDSILREIDQDGRSVRNF